MDSTRLLDSIDKKGSNSSRLTKRMCLTLLDQAILIPRHTMSLYSLLSHLRIEEKRLKFTR